MMMVMMTMMMMMMMMLTMYEMHHPKFDANRIYVKGMEEEEAFCNLDGYTSKAKLSRYRPEQAHGRSVG
jgi:hypothetical protein